MLKLCYDINTSVANLSYVESFIIIMIIYCLNLKLNSIVSAIE